MPALLESIAEQNRLHVVSLSHIYQDESRAILTTLSPQYRAQRATEAARFLAHHLPTPIGSLEMWVTEVGLRLRKGLNKNTFCDLIDSGLAFMKACQDLINMANRVSQDAALFGDLPEAKEVQKIIVKNMVRLKNSEYQLLYWKKIADRQPPEIDFELIERGAEQIRQGEFMTPEQALEAIRDAAK